MEPSKVIKKWESRTKLWGWILFGIILLDIVFDLIFINLNLNISRIHIMNKFFHYSSLSCLAIYIFCLATLFSHCVTWIITFQEFIEKNTKNKEEDE